MDFTSSPSAPSRLQTFVHGERLAHLAELDELLTEPAFSASSPTSNRERNLRTYGRLVAVGRHHGGSVALAGDTNRLNTVQEWMAVVDPCLFHAALVHFAVCTWSIRALGRPAANLAELTDDLDRQRAAGTILITEVGRSNSHIALATEARYDPRSRTFTLRTPDDGAAKLMANVAEPGVPKIAIVFAELVAGERRCGVFPFAMRIQTEDGPAQGVRVAALSDVPAVPLDYALVRFEDAEVPFDSWLCDSASLDADGAFADPLEDRGQRLVRSLAFGAHVGLGAAVGLAAAARASVTIALRHAGQRITLGTLAPGLEVLGYSTVQWALYSALADGCATTFLVDDAKRWYRQGAPVQARAGAQTFAPWSAVNRDLALTKAAAAACLARVTAACRISGGAQGLLAANRVTQYEGMSQVLQSAAGDSLLTRLDAGKTLVQDEAYEVDTTGAAATDRLRRPSGGARTVRRQGGRPAGGSARARARGGSRRDAVRGLEPAAAGDDRPRRRVRAQPHAAQLRRARAIGRRAAGRRPAARAATASRPERRARRPGLAPRARLADGAAARRPARVARAGAVGGARARCGARPRVRDPGATSSGDDRRAGICHRGRPAVRRRA